MKKSLLRIISLLLTIGILSLMVSCDLSTVFGDIVSDDLGNGVENGSDNITYPTYTTDKNQSSPKDTSIGYTPPGKINFDGREIHILYRDDISFSREWFKETPTDELDEAIALRNQTVEETLNVKIVLDPVSTAGSYDMYSKFLSDIVLSDVNSGTHAYDISFNLAYPSASASIRDCAANLLNQELFPYFNFEFPCWNQSIVKNTSLYDKLFYVAGTFNLSMYDTAAVVWQNKDLYDQLREPSDPENMQTQAIDGSWTYEELEKWAIYYNDANPENETDDTYGIHINRSAIMDAFPYAWDLEYVTKDSNDSLSFNVSNDDKRAQANFKLGSLGSIGVYDTTDVKLFAKGQSVFYMGMLNEGRSSNVVIREMSDKYALLPMPKYDVDQEKYHTTSIDDFTLTFVLDNGERGHSIRNEAVSAFLQLTAENTQTIIDLTYQTCVVKPKFFRADPSDETLRWTALIYPLVIEGINFDFVNLYSEQFKDIFWYSSSEEYAPIFEESLRDLDEWFKLTQK